MNTFNASQSQPLNVQPVSKVNKIAHSTGGNNLSVGSHFEKSKRHPLSSRSYPITTLQQPTTTRSRQIAFDSLFKDFGLISLLCIPYQLSTRPILAVPLPEPKEPEPLSITDNIPKSIEECEGDPCIILRSVLSHPPSSLSTIPEGGLEGEDNNTRAPHSWIIQPSTLLYIVIQSAFKTQTDVLCPHTSQTKIVIGCMA
ncbi:hypothetical protein FRC15_007231 [Serendipita sp. 397]|nr:hypothetical protein FRC15_007231 [Serendipita sp. 397]KAG8767075.1 hypothetical protein FRC16_007488 [Serendipita sp. 398]